MQNLLTFVLTTCTLVAILNNQLDAQDLNNKTDGMVLNNIRSISRPWENKKRFMREKHTHPMNTIRGTTIPNDTILPEWVNIYSSELINSDDIPRDMAIDDDGNIYITGSSDSTFTGRDYITIKYNSLGEKIWTARYNGPGYSHDEAFAIAVDKYGNIYVTGQSYGEYSCPDLATIKYNSSGTIVWISRHNDADDFSYNARDIAVDDSGNVYVTGDFTGSTSYHDYVTIKYNSNGVEQWVATFNGAGNADDFVRGITLDNFGNAYVAGYSEGIGTNYDYATIKYNSSGEEEWVAIYQGPNNSADFANAITTDESGNVYVTGGSDTVGRHADYTTIKYNSYGMAEWIVRYNGPINSMDAATAIAVDASGNVFVTGFSEGVTTKYDYATVKYNSTGVEQWVSRYNGPGNGDDRASEITVDDYGNVFVSGYSRANSVWPFNEDYATIKYDSAGVEQWVNRYDGPATDYDYPVKIGLDKDGNIIVTGYSSGIDYSRDFATIKYNSSGAVRWVEQYDGSGFSYGWSIGVVADQAGNIYVAGPIYSSTTGNDFLLIKYNSAGIQQWTARYNGTANDDDYPWAIALDSSGNIYITGATYDAATLYDFATVKYNSQGVEQWVAIYNSPGNYDNQANAIAIDAAENLYVTGTSNDSISGYNFTTVKYNSSGIEQWVANYNGSGNGEDYPVAVAVDATGNVYVTGMSEGSGTDYDYCTVKYNSAGEEQWVARYDGPVSSADSPCAMVIDGSGNTYVTGQSIGSGTGGDYATIKYDSLGTEQWVARYDGPSNNEESPAAMAIDNKGNIYVVGSSESDSTSDDFCTIKYNSSGVQQWIAAYNGPANSSDGACAIAIDGVDNIYVTGTSEGESGKSNFFTIKYDTSGTELWTARHDGPGNCYNFPNSIALDNQGNVILTGYSGKEQWSVFTTIKYPSTLVSVKENKNFLADRYYLYQNYPNPFNPNTNIRYQLPSAGWVTLKVYNLLGQEVKTLVNEFQIAGDKSIEWNANNLPSGVYTYRLTASGYILSRKMVLLK